jgi:hypothetical protein
MREFTQGGLYLLGSRILLEANKEQVQANPPNLPNAITFDRKLSNLKPAEAKRFSALDPKGTLIPGWRRRIVVTYGYQLELFKSFEQALLDLQNLTRIKTATALSTYYFLCKDNNNGKADESRNRVFRTRGQVKTWLEQAQARGPNVSVAILGPTVTYRRKIVYNPRARGYKQLSKKGGKHFEAKALSKKLGAFNRKGEINAYLKNTATDRIFGFDDPKTRGLQATTSRDKKRILIQFERKNAFHKLVVRRRKANFARRGIWIAYGFVPSRLPLPPDPKTGKKYGLPRGKYPHGQVPILYLAGRVR